MHIGGHHTDHCHRRESAWTEIQLKRNCSFRKSSNFTMADDNKDTAFLIEEYINDITLLFNACKKAKYEDVCNILSSHEGDESNDFKSV